MGGRWEEVGKMGTSGARTASESPKVSSRISLAMQPATDDQWFNPTWGCTSDDGRYNIPFGGPKRCYRIFLCGFDGVNWTSF